MSVIAQYDDHVETDEEVVVTPILPPKQKLYYVLGHVQGDICECVLLAYFLVYMTTFASVNEMDTGIIFQIGQFVDATFTVFLRYNCDQIRFKHYGRRKIVHLFGTIIVLISFIVFLNDCACTTRLGRTAYYGLFMALYRIGYTSCQISHLALIPEISVQEDDVSFLSKLRSCVTYSSKAFVFLIVWCFIKLQKEPWDTVDNPLFRHLSFVLAVVGLLTTTAFHIGLEEPRLTFVKKSIYLEKDSYFHKFSCKKKKDVPYDLAKVLLKERKVETWRQCLRNKEFYKACTLHIISRLCANCFNIYFVVYITNALSVSMTTSACVLLLISFTGLATTFILKSVTRIAGKKVMLTIACIVTIASCASLHLVTQLKFVFAAAVGVGCGVTTINWISFSEVETITTSRKTFSSINDTLEKLLTGVTVSCVQVFRWQAGSSSVKVVDELPRIMVSIVPIALTSFVLICYTIFFPSQFTCSRKRETKDTATQTSNYEVSEAIKARIHLEISWDGLNELTDKVGQKLAYPNLPSPIF